MTLPTPPEDPDSATLPTVAALLGEGLRRLDNADLATDAMCTPDGFRVIKVPGVGELGGSDLAAYVDHTRQTAQTYILAALAAGIGEFLDALADAAQPTGEQPT